MWVQANLTPPQPSPTPQASPSSQASPSPLPTPTPITLQPIHWGNSVEAAVLADGRRIALTQHHVVIMDVRSGQGSGCVTVNGTPCYLDLDAQMAARLGTWKFVY